MTNFCNPLVLLDLKDLPLAELQPDMLGQTRKRWMADHKKQGIQTIVYQGMPLDRSIAIAALKLLDNPAMLHLLHRLHQERDLSDFLHGRSEVSFGNIARSSIWDDPELKQPLRTLLQPALAASLAHALRTLNRRRVLEITTLVESTPTLEADACYAGALDFIETQTKIIAGTALDPSDPDYARRARAIRKDFNKGAIYEARNFNTLPGYYFRTALTPLALAMSELARLSFQAEPAFSVKMFSTARLLELDNPVHQQIEAAYSLTAGKWEPPIEEKDPEPPLPPPPPPKRKPPPPKPPPPTQPYSQPYTPPPPPPPPQNSPDFWGGVGRLLGNGRVLWILAIIAFNIFRNADACSITDNSSSVNSWQYEPGSTPTDGTIVPSSGLENIWPLIQPPIDTIKIKNALEYQYFKPYERALLFSYLESARKKESEDALESIYNTPEVVEAPPELVEEVKEVNSLPAPEVPGNGKLFGTGIPTRENYSNCTTVLVKGDPDWDAVVFSRDGSWVVEEVLVKKGQTVNLCIGNGNNNILVVFGKNWSSKKISPANTQGYFAKVGNAYWAASKYKYEPMFTNGKLQLQSSGGRGWTESTEAIVFRMAMRTDKKF